MKTQQELYQTMVGLSIMSIRAKMNVAENHHEHTPEAIEAGMRTFETMIYTLCWILGHRPQELRKVTEKMAGELDIPIDDSSIERFTEITQALDLAAGHL